METRSPPPPHRLHQRPAAGAAETEATRRRSCKSCPPQSSPRQALQLARQSSAQLDNIRRPSGGMPSIAAWIPRLLERAATPFMTPQVELNSFSLRDESLRQDDGIETTRSQLYETALRSNSRLSKMNKKLLGHQRDDSKGGKKSKERYFKSERLSSPANQEYKRAFGTPKKEWIASITTNRANKKPKPNVKVLIDQTSPKNYFSKADVEFQTPARLTLDQVEKSKPRSKHYHPSAFRATRSESPKKATIAENKAFKMVDNIDSDEESTKETKDKSKERPTPTAFRIYKYKSPTSTNEEAKIRSSVAKKSSSLVLKSELKPIDIHTDTTRSELQTLRAETLHEPPKTQSTLLKQEKQIPKVEPQHEPPKLKSPFKQREKQEKLSNQIEQRSLKKISSSRVNKTNTSKKVGKKARMPSPEIKVVDISPTRKKEQCQQQPDKGSQIKSLSKPYSAPISKHHQDDRCSARDMMLKSYKSCNKTVENDPKSFVKDVLTKSKANVQQKQALISDLTTTSHNKLDDTSDNEQKSKKEAFSRTIDIFEKSRNEKETSQQIPKSTVPCSKDNALKVADLASTKTQLKELDNKSDNEQKNKKEAFSKTIDIFENIRSRTEKDTSQQKPKSAVPCTKDNTLKVTDLATWQMKASAASQKSEKGHEKIDAKSPSGPIDFRDSFKETTDKQSTKADIAPAHTQGYFPSHEKEKSYKTSNRKTNPEPDTNSVFPHYVKEKDVQLRYLPPTQPSSIDGQIGPRDMDCLKSLCPAPPLKAKHSVEEDTTLSEVYTLNSQQAPVEEAKHVSYIEKKKNRLESKWDSDYCESTCSDGLLAAKKERESVFFQKNVMSSASAEMLKYNENDQYFSIFT